MPELDPTIEALNLNETAKSAAYDLKAKHPGIVFTSGRRDKTEQARAMASNVVKNRKWIAQTYKPTPISAACQKWLDDNPLAKSGDAIEAGLLSVINQFGDSELRKLSKHLSGDAFDVQPVTQNAAQITADMNALAEAIGGKFLSKEGGLIRWHIQF
jgi:hypothetical protein